MTMKTCYAPVTWPVRGTARQGAFTLLEVMVVLAVIATLMAVAMFAIQDGGKKQFRDESSRFALLIKSLVDEAIIDSTMFGILVSDESYQFLRYNTETQLWQTWQQRPYIDRVIPENWQTALWIDEEAVDIPNKDDIKLTPDESEDEQESAQALTWPQIVVLPDGEITPFLLEWSSPDHTSQIKLADGFSVDFEILHESL